MSAHPDVRFMVVATIDTDGTNRREMVKPRVQAHRPGAGFVYRIIGDDVAARTALHNCHICAASSGGVIDRRRAPGA